MVIPCHQQIHRITEFALKPVADKPEHSFNAGQFLSVVFGIHVVIPYFLVWTVITTVPFNISSIPPDIHVGSIAKLKAFSYIFLLIPTMRNDDAVNYYRRMHVWMQLVFYIHNITAFERDWETEPQEIKEVTKLIAKV